MSEICTVLQLKTVSKGFPGEKCTSSRNHLCDCRSKQINNRREISIIQSLRIITSTVLRWTTYSSSDKGALPRVLSTSGLELMKAGIVWWRPFCRVSTSSKNACCTHSASTFWASVQRPATSTSQLKKWSSSDELAIHTASASASPLHFYTTPSS